MRQQMNRPPSIRIAFRTLGRTVRHGYDNLGTLLLGSILWGVIAALAAPFAIFAFRAPSVGSALLFLIAIMILPISPATASLHRITQRMTEERASSWSMGMFWENFRRDWGWSSRLVLTLMVGFLLVAVNEQFYIRVNNAFIPFLSVLFLVFLIVWLGVIMFAVPLALRQEQPHLRTTLRNTLIIVLANLPGVIVSLV